MAKINLQKEILKREIRIVYPSLRKTQINLTKKGA